MAPMNLGRLKNFDVVTLMSMAMAILVLICMSPFVFFGFPGEWLKTKPMDTKPCFWPKEVLHLRPTLDTPRKENTQRIGIHDLLIQRGSLDIYAGRTRGGWQFKSDAEYLEQKMQRGAESNDQLENSKKIINSKHLQTINRKMAMGTRPSTKDQKKPPAAKAIFLKAREL